MLYSVSSKNPRHKVHYIFQVDNERC